MWASLAIVLPVFGLIGLGYAARRLGLVSDATGEGLSDFVFTLSVPCLIFRTLARAELPAVQPWGYWIAYFAAVAIVWAVASLAAGRFFHVGRTEAVAAGFAAGQANTVLVGIPLILKAYGEEGAVPCSCSSRSTSRSSWSPARFSSKDAGRRSAGSPSACFCTR